MKRKQKTKHLEITYPPQSEKTSRGMSEGVLWAQGYQDLPVDRGRHQGSQLWW